MAAIAAFAVTAGATPPARAAVAGHAPEPPAEGDAPPSESDEMLARAMAAYERGQTNYRRANYEEALVDFKEAATLYASPDFQYNIARCYEKLERYDEAILAYETYLRAKPDASDREDVEASIGFLEQKAEEKRAEAKQPSEPTVVVAPPPDDSQDVPQGKPAKPLIITGAVLTGVGAALALGGGIGFGVAAQNRSDDIFFIQEEGNPDEATLADTRALDEDGKRFETLQIVTAAVGGAIAVTGVSLLAVGLVRKKANASDEAGARLDGIGPTMHRGFAGLGLHGRF